MSNSKKSFVVGSSTGRPPKGHPPSGDFFALGNKPVVRQGSPNISGPPIKKPHVEEDEGEVLFSDPIRISQVTAVTPVSSSKISTVMIQAIEVRSTELVAVAMESLENNNIVKAHKVIFGALKQLKNARLKIDFKLNEALIKLAVSKPSLFSVSSSIEGLLSVLKREAAAIFKTRCEPSTYALACNLLMIALRDSNDWPESLAKTYVDDALGDRVWVDLKPCLKLVDNIVTLFNTKSIETEEPSESDSTVQDQTETDQASLNALIKAIPVQPRFSLPVCRSVFAYVIQLVQEQLGRRGLQPSDIQLRNYLKFLTTTAGLPEIRLFVVEKFEQWIQNSKLVKLVYDLLCTVAINCCQHTPEDIKVLETLLNVKLKTRLFFQQYVACIKEFITVHSENLEIVMHRVVTNELTQSVHQSINIQLLTMIFQQWPDEAANVMGTIFQHFLCFREDYVRLLKGFLRELVRQVRSEKFPFTVFCRALVQQRSDPEFVGLGQLHKDYVASSVADLLACSCMLTASTVIREAYVNYSKGDRNIISYLRDFFETLSLIQRDSIWWVHSVLPSFCLQPTDYKTCLRKVLFLEPPESYSKDNWPAENERTPILQLMTESCLHGDSLMRILVLGLTKELPLSPSDALDIADKLVARAASVHTSDIPRVPLLENTELFRAVFDITAYHPPSSISIPSTFKAPNLAISKLYWKGWILLLVLAAFNPKTIGSVGWTDYPTLKAMMIMVMTNNYSLTDFLSKIQGNKPAAVLEQQLTQDEKETVLKYENYLALSSLTSETVITESTSYLLNHVTRLHPQGPVRKIPSSAIDLIKSVNSSLRLGKLLCQCREPDFLLEIIQEQGTSKAMSWLRDLVDGSQSSLDILPVPCLCEFLLASYQERGLTGELDQASEGENISHRAHFKRKQRVQEKVVHQHEQMISRLKTLVSNPTSPTTCLDILNYFIDKLSSSINYWALKALTDILSCKSVDDRRTGNKLTMSWLLQSIPSLTVFSSISQSLIKSIISACQVEMNADIFMAYLHFITTHVSQEMLHQVTTKLAFVISERYNFFGNAYEFSHQDDAMIALLRMLRVTFDAYLHTEFQHFHETNELLSLSLPIISCDCQVVVPAKFIEAIFIVLSLVDVVCSGDSQHLINILLPSESKHMPQPCSLLSKEPLPLVKEEILHFVFCNADKKLVEMLISQFQPNQLYCLMLYGVPQSNMDIVLANLQVEATQAIIDQVEAQHLRGCISGHFYSSLVSDQRHSLDKNVKTVLSMGTIPRLVFSTAVVQTSHDIQSSLSMEEAFSLFLSTNAVVSLRSVLTFLQYILSNYYMKGTLTDLEKNSVANLIESVQLLAADQLRKVESVFKDVFVWRLFYLLSHVVIHCSDANDAYHEHLISLKNQMSDNRVDTLHQIMEACVHLRVPPSKKVVTVSYRLKDSLHKMLTDIMQNRVCVEENLLCFVRYYVLDALQEQGIHMLLKVKSNNTSLSVKGLICDLIEIIDPEIVSVSPLVHSCLFSVGDIMYLLEKSIHQASWSTFQKSLLRALSDAIMNINSTLLLNVLWTCVHLPTLWQGKVKKEAVIDSNLSLGIEPSRQLVLTNDHVFTVVNHVLREMLLNANSVIITRLPLLIACSKDKIADISKYLAHLLSNEANQMLIHLYLADEIVGQFIPSFSDCSLLSQPSRMDCYVRDLLISMTSIPNGDDDDHKVTSASLLCRQLVVSHPQLILRHLPFLGCLLRGRATLSQKQFSDHLIVFTNAFHLLNMFQPSAFLTGTEIECCLEPFMDFLKYQCLRNGTYHILMGKFLSFLCRYCQYLGAGAHMFLRKHQETLYGLKNAFPKHQNVIQDLLDMLPAQSMPNLMNIEHNCSIDALLKCPPVLSSSYQGHSYVQLLPFIQKLGNHETIFQVLQDLEESSVRSVEILHQFVPILCQLTQSSDPASVELAHDLLFRHLRYSPQSYKKILPSIIACLHSSNSVTVAATIQYIPDLILLSSGEDAAFLISLLFKLSVVSPVDQELKKIVYLLTAHTKI